MLVGERRDLRTVRRERDVLLHGARAEADGRLPKEIREVDPLPGGPDAAVLERAELEQIADEPVEEAAGGLGPAQVRPGVAHAAR